MSGQVWKGGFLYWRWALDGGGWGGHAFTRRGAKRAIRRFIERRQQQEQWVANAERVEL